MSLRWEYLNGLPEDMTEKQETIANNLPDLLFFTDIGYLCEESVEEFCYRLRMYYHKEKITSKDLEPFFGLKVNVITEDALEWAKKRFVRREPAMPGQTSKIIANKGWARKINNLRSLETDKKAKLRIID